MLKARHDFIKNIYNDYIIIYIKNNYYYIYDYEFLYLLKGKLINKLNENHINYLIIDNMNIINKNIFNDNKYNYYNIRFIIYRIITKQ